MNSLFHRFAAGIAGFALAAAAAAVPIAVTTSADDGGGTFRAAVEAANGDPAVDSIVFDVGLGTVTLESTVEYTGAQALAIFGSEATITGDGFADDLFRSTGGGDLWIGHLAFDGSGGNGVRVDVPLGPASEQRVTLYRVAIDGSAGFGLLVEDQDNDSDRSVALGLFHSAITDNGVVDGVNNDQDGVRVNEGGVGGIRAEIVDTMISGNAYDGIELDEKGTGDVWASVNDSTFVENGFGFAGDLEDGLDVDEDDAGEVYVALVETSSNDNAEDGFDLNEAADGSIEVNANRVTATGNGQRGQDVEEEGDGNIAFHAQDARYADNIGDGIRNSEENAGNLIGRLLRTSVTGNDDDGYDAEQSKSSGSGRGVIYIQKGSSVTGNAKNFELDNVVKRQQ